MSDCEVYNAVKQYTAVNWFLFTVDRNSKETGVLCDESEGIPATVTELIELRRIIRLFPVK